MKFKIILSFVIVFFACKKAESVNKDEVIFNQWYEEGCYPQGNDVNQLSLPCIKKTENLGCFNFYQSAQEGNLDKAFRNTNWISEDYDVGSYYYYMDSQNKVKVKVGGPSRSEKSAAFVGIGRIYKLDDELVYEQTCNSNNCPTQNFKIEFINCSVRYIPEDNEHRLFLMISDRNFYNKENSNSANEKSLVLRDILKPQIENGFELYLVPLPPK